MLTLNKSDIQANLPYPELIEGLRSAFKKNPKIPARQHLKVPVAHSTPATLLLMPAWDHSYVGVKIASVFPENGARGLPAIDAIYVLKSGETGETLAILDGAEITRIRTAATSALASSYLSRPDSKTLLMVGAGALAVPLIRAHSHIRTFTRVQIWNRSERGIDQVRSELENEMEVQHVSDLNEATAGADVISCATLSSTPLVLREHVRQGTHVDLVGAYLPTMRESNAELISTSSIFVDTRAGACVEGGDLVQAALETSFKMEDVKAELSELCQGIHSGRESNSEVSVFKSVGASIEDLVAASIVFNRFSK
ncbi:ornithine cyclodeaminase family protein [bacterium]|nr:ornithine cyclodeaminase family protein [bacterium]